MLVAIMTIPIMGRYLLKKGFSGKILIFGWGEGGEIDGGEIGLVTGGTTGGGRFWAELSTAYPVSHFKNILVNQRRQIIGRGKINTYLLLSS